MIARAAPAVFPMPFHRSLDVVDREDARVEKVRAGQVKRRAREAAR